MHRNVCCLFSLVFGSRLADCLEDASNEPCGLSKPSQLILTRKFVAGCCCCPLLLLLLVAVAAAVAVILPQHKSNYTHTHTQAHAAINKVRGHMLNMLYGLCYIRPMPRYTIYGMVYDHTLFFCACVCVCVWQIFYWLFICILHRHRWRLVPQTCQAAICVYSSHLFSRIIMLIYLLCLIYVNMLLAL